MAPEPRSPDARTPTPERLGRAGLMGLTAGALLGGGLVLASAARTALRDVDCDGLPAAECTLQQELLLAASFQEALLGAALTLLGLLLLLLVLRLRVARVP